MKSEVWTKAYNNLLNDPELNSVQWLSNNKEKLY